MNDKGKYAEHMTDGSDTAIYYNVYKRYHHRLIKINSLLATLRSFYSKGQNAPQLYKQIKDKQVKLDSELRSLNLKNKKDIQERRQLLSELSDMNLKLGLYKMITYADGKDTKHNDEYTDELYHWGILGMHWGVRRYQPYSATGPRKSGESGKEIGDAAKAKNGGPSLSTRQRRAKIKNIRKEEAKKEREIKKQEHTREKAIKEEKKRVKTRAEFEKDKAKVLASGDYEKILKFNNKHRDMITANELQTAVNRINAERSLASFAPQAKTGQYYVDKAIKYGQNMNSLMTTGANLYNNFNNINNIVNRRR